MLLTETIKDKPNQTKMSTDKLIISPTTYAPMKYAETNRLALIEHLDSLYNAERINYVNLVASIQIAQINIDMLNTKIDCMLARKTCISEIERIEMNELIPMEEKILELQAKCQESLLNQENLLEQLDD